MLIVGSAPSVGVGAWYCSSGDFKCWLRTDLGILPSIGTVLAWNCQGTESKYWLRSDLGVLPSVGAVLAWYCSSSVILNVG